MDLTTRTATYAQDNKQWLASAADTGTGDTIEILVSTLTAGTHYPLGFLPSGFPLGRITATGKYGLYDDALSNGQNVAAGFLLEPVRITDPLGGAAPTAVVGSLLRRGFVYLSKLPLALDANGQADLAAKFVLLP